MKSSYMGEFMNTPIYGGGAAESKSNFCASFPHNRLLIHSY